MMSGMRKAPPISTSSPRETMTSRPEPRALSISSTAAALLLTTVTASAPVNARSCSSTRSSRSPRLPVSMSHSRFIGQRSASTTACTATSGSRARPRLVCSTVPVRLNTGRRREAFAAPRRSPSRARIASGARSSAAPSRKLARKPERNSSSSARKESTVCSRPYSAINAWQPCASSRTCTAGRRGIGAAPPVTRRPSARAAGCRWRAHSRLRTRARRAAGWPGRRPMVPRCSRVPG